MKIALALETFDPHRGDLEASTSQLADRLIRLKHDVHVVAQHFSEAGLNIPIVPHRIRATRSPLRRAARADAALQALNADVVHDMGVTWNADVFTSHVGSPIGRWQRQLKGTAWWSRPARQIAFRLRPLHRRHAELARRQLECSDSIVVALSQMVAHDYRSIHDVAPERIRLVHHGVDIKKFSPHIGKLRRESSRRKLGIDKKELLLVSVAKDPRQDVLATSLRAVKRLLAKGLPVQLIVANIDRGAAAQKLAARLGVDRQIRFVGPVADPIPYYAAADVLLSPTRYDACSLRVLEAAACGLPCITTRHDGAAELLTDGADCYVLDRISAPDLADRIESLHDPARRERMGRAARRTAMKHTLEGNVDQILQIYEELVERRRGADQTQRNILKLSEAGDCRPASRRAA